MTKICENVNRPEVRKSFKFWHVDQTACSLASSVVSLGFVVFPDWVWSNHVVRWIAMADVSCAVVM